MSYSNSDVVSMINDKINLETSIKEARNFKNQIHPLNRLSLGRNFKSKRMEILPNIFSDNIKYLSFLKELSIKASELFPSSDIDNSGLSTGPILGDFFHLYTKAGTVRFPLDFNRPLLNPSVPLELQKIIKDNISLFFKEPDHSARGIISKDSNSGSPFFSNDIVSKKKHSKLISDNLEYLVKNYSNMDTIDRNGLYKNIRILNVDTVQVRLQVDFRLPGNKPKKRKHVPFENNYLSNGHREIFEFGEESGPQSCRTRTVIAKANPLNNFMSDVFERYKKSYIKRYYFTFKHGSPQSVKDKIKNFKYFAGADVSSFDSKIPFSIMKCIIDHIPVAEPIRNMIYDLILSPWYISHTLSSEPLISESYNNKLYSTWKGTPSGIFFTSMINNIIMSFILFWEFRKVNIGYSFEQFLLGVTPVSACIWGDDVFLVSNTYDVSQHVYENAFVVIAVEKGVKFAGFIFYRDALKNMELNYSLDLRSLYSKFFIPEKDINSKFRPYPYLGFFQRLNEDVYGTNIFTEKALELLYSTFHKYFGFNLEFMLKERSKEDELRLNKFVSELDKKYDSSALSEIDKEVLNNPNLIYYKYDEDDLSELLRSHIISRTDEEVHDNNTNFLIKNNLIAA